MLSVCFLIAKHRGYARVGAQGSWGGRRNGRCRWGPRSRAIMLEPGCSRLVHWVSYALLHPPAEGCAADCFRFASSASALEDQWHCGKKLCNFSSESVVCVNFRSLASYWPRPWSDFGVPLGARRLPKRGPETSKRQPQTTQTASVECLCGAFGAGPPEGGREPQGDNPGDPKWASRRRGVQVFGKAQNL